MCFLYAGMSGTLQPFPQPPSDVNLGFGFTALYATLATAIQGQGWYVIGQPLTVGQGLASLGQNAAVKADLDNDPNGSGSAVGTRFLQNQQRWYDHWDVVMQEDFPANMPRVDFGFSWGGWAAMQSALYSHPQGANIVAYGAHHPASKMSYLNTSVVNLTAYPTTAMDVGAAAFQAVNKPGYFGWGTIDNLVDEPDGGDLLTPAIYTAAHGAGMPVSPNCNGTGNSSGGTPQTHSLTSTDVTVITTWFESWQSAYPANK